MSNLPTKNEPKGLQPVTPKETKAKPKREYNSYPVPLYKKILNLMKAVCIAALAWVVLNAVLGCKQVPEKTEPKLRVDSSVLGTDTLVYVPKSLFNQPLIEAYEILLPNKYLINKVSLGEERFKVLTFTSQNNLSIGDRIMMDFKDCYPANKIPLIKQYLALTDSVNKGALKREMKEIANEF